MFGVYNYKYICMFQGILDPDGRINNKKSITRLAEVAVAYAKAGERESLVCDGCNVMLCYYCRLSCSSTIRHDGQ